jgi:hypothetical protein
MEFEKETYTLGRRWAFFTSARSLNPQSEVDSCSSLNDATLSAAYLKCCNPLQSLADSIDSCPVLPENLH